MNHLYHFTTAKFALDDLRNRRLKIAQLDDLNDPFELKSVNLCDPEHAQAFDGIEEKNFEGYKAAVARRWGVLCFSEEKNRYSAMGALRRPSQGNLLGLRCLKNPRKVRTGEVQDNEIPFPRETGC